jgi:hypothetical protein
MNIVMNSVTPFALATAVLAMNCGQAAQPVAVDAGVEFRSFTLM